MCIITCCVKEETSIRVAGDAGCGFSLVPRLGSLLDWSEKEKVETRVSQQN